MSSPIKEGFIRLYRTSIEHPRTDIDKFREYRKLYHDGSLYNHNDFHGNLTAVVAEMLLEQDYDKGVGRWFADSLDEVMWYQYEENYIDDKPEAKVFYIDLPAETAEQFRLRNLPDDTKNVKPKFYSKKHDAEFFLPQDVARDAVEYPQELWDENWQKYLTQRELEKSLEMMKRMGDIETILTKEPAKALV